MLLKPQTRQSLAAHKWLEPFGSESPILQEIHCTLFKKKKVINGYNHAGLFVVRFIISYMLCTHYTML